MAEEPSMDGETMEKLMDVIGVLGALPQDHTDAQNIPHILSSKDSRYFIEDVVSLPDHCFLTAMFNSVHAYRNLGLHVVVGTLGFGATGGKIHWEHGNRNGRKVSDFAKPEGMDVHVWLENDAGDAVWDVTTHKDVLSVPLVHKVRINVQPREVIAGLSHHACAEKGLHYIPAPLHVQHGVMTEYFKTSGQLLFVIQCATAYPFVIEHNPVRGRSIQGGPDEQRVVDATCKSALETQGGNEFCDKDFRESHPECAHFCRDTIVERLRQHVVDRCRTNTDFVYSLFYTPWGQVDVEVSLESVQVIVTIRNGNSRTGWHALVSPAGWDRPDKWDKHPQFGQFPRHIRSALLQLAKSNEILHPAEDVWVCSIPTYNNVDRVIQSCIDMNDLFRVESSYHFLTAIMSTTGTVYTSMSRMYMREIVESSGLFLWPRHSVVEGEISHMGNDFVLTSPSALSKLTMFADNPGTVVLEMPTQLTTSATVTVLDRMFESRQATIQGGKSIYTWTSDALSWTPIWRAMFMDLFVRRKRWKRREA